MNPRISRLQHQTRRTFLRESSVGLGSLALASLLHADTPGGAPNPLAPRKPHFPAKAKRVIYLHLSGAPPHLDLFDYKPELVKRSGQNCPDEYTKGKRFAFTSGTPRLMGTPRKFGKYGKSGVELSDAVPHLHEVADDLCVIRSMNTDQFNHAPAELLLYTGSPRQGRPSIGTWVTYGLGTENETLPGCVALMASRPAARGAGGAGVCRASSRVSSAGPRATRSSTSPTPPGWTGTCAAGGSTPSRTSTSCRRRSWATRRR